MAPTAWEFCMVRGVCGYGCSLAIQRARFAGRGSRDVPRGICVRTLLFVGVSNLFLRLSRTVPPLVLVVGTHLGAVSACM